MQHVSEGLIAVLQEQILCAEAMLQTLGRENQALTSGDPEQLNAAGADKAQLVETLDALERQRRSLTDAVATGVATAAAGATQPAEWRRLREEWRRFVARDPTGPQADEARVRAIEAGREAWRRGSDPADEARFLQDAADYLERDDAAQKERVKGLLR